jgi:hypothetical protein
VEEATFRDALNGWKRNKALKRLSPSMYVAVAKVLNAT